MDGKFKLSKTVNLMQIMQLIKVITLAISTPFGLLISTILTFSMIDFNRIMEEFDFKNLNSVYFVKETLPIWYLSILKWFGIIFIIAFLGWLTQKYIFKKVADNKDILPTFFGTIMLSIVLFGLTQPIVPLMIMGLIMAFFILLLFFATANLFQLILRFIVAYFAKILEFFFLKFEIPFELGMFIGQDELSLLLSIIIFLISMPYIFSIVFSGIKGTLKHLIGSEAIIDIIFRPVDIIFQLNTVRRFIYLVLFLLSIVTYSYSISEMSNYLYLLKESLLGFVLLDTVIYSIYESFKAKSKLKRRIKYIQFILPFKQDLEFVSSIINNHCLFNTGAKVKVKFSLPLDNLKHKKNKQFSRISNKIIRLDEKFLTYNDLFIEANKTLKDIYLYEAENDF